jgi:hypothetical protein
MNIRYKPCPDRFKNWREEVFENCGKTESGQEIERFTR